MLEGRGRRRLLKPRTPARGERLVARKLEEVEQELEKRRCLVPNTAELARSARIHFGHRRTY